MNGNIFSILNKDYAGRIGQMKTTHGVIETPSFVPVINPHDQIIKPSEMKKLGVNIIITNSYIINSNEKLKEKILSKGLHSFFNFDGPIMTDSGSYQLSVYGHVNIRNNEIIEFQNDIGSDICVPLDIPTSPDENYKKTCEDLKITNERIKEAEKIYKEKKYTSILACPIQGSTHINIREQSSKYGSSIDCGLYPIGAVVPLMESYRYGELVSVIIASKKYLNPLIPVHLFGAGHPSMLGLSVLLGCDLFDSASYALYAKNNRYITERGTYKIEDMKYFSCSCEVCSSYNPKELLTDENKVYLLSKHNLISILNEVNAIKQAITDKRLFELVSQRCHCHPKLLDGLMKLKKYSSILESVDVASKSTLFSIGPMSSIRSEVMRYRLRVSRFNFIDVNTCLIRIGKSSIDYKYDQLLNFKPPFGSYPIELEETYPFNFESTSVPSYQELRIGITNTIKLIKTNGNISFSFLINKYMLYIDKKLIDLLSKYCTLVYDKKGEDIYL